MVMEAMCVSCSVIIIAKWFHCHHVPTPTTHTTHTTPHPHTHTGGTTAPLVDLRQRSSWTTNQTLASWLGTARVTTLTSLYLSGEVNTRIWPCWFPGDIFILELDWPGVFPTLTVCVCVCDPYCSIWLPSYIDRTVSIHMFCRSIGKLWVSSHWMVCLNCFELLSQAADCYICLYSYAYKGIFCVCVNHAIINVCINTFLFVFGNTIFGTDFSESRNCYNVCS